MSETPIITTSSFMSTGSAFGTFATFVVAITPPMNFQPFLKKHILLLSGLLHLLTVGSFTSSATSEYELSAQEIHDEIERLCTTFKTTGTSPYRGTSVRLCTQRKGQ